MRLYSASKREINQTKTQTIEMRAVARDTDDGGFVPLVGQQLYVLFSRSADFVLAKLTSTR